jgi:hypothetical protein
LCTSKARNLAQRATSSGRVSTGSHNRTMQLWTARAIPRPLRLRASLGSLPAWRLGIAAVQASPPVRCSCGCSFLHCSPRPASSAGQSATTQQAAHAPARSQSRRPRPLLRQPDDDRPGVDHATTNDRAHDYCSREGEGRVHQAAAVPATHSSRRARAARSAPTSPPRRPSTRKRRTCRSQHSSARRS